METKQYRTLCLIQDIDRELDNINEKMELVNLDNPVYEELQKKQEILYGRYQKLNSFLD